MSVDSVVACCVCGLSMCLKYACLCVCACITKHRRSTGFMFSLYTYTVNREMEREKKEGRITKGGRRNLQKAAMMHSERLRKRVGKEMYAQLCCGDNVCKENKSTNEQQRVGESQKSA